MENGEPTSEREATAAAGTLMVLGFCLGGPALLVAPQLPGAWRLVLGVGGLGLCLLALSVWVLALAPFGHFGVLGRWLLSHAGESSPSEANPETQADPSAETAPEAPKSAEAADQAADQAAEPDPEGATDIDLKDTPGAQAEPTPGDTPAPAAEPAPESAPDIDPPQTPESGATHQPPSKTP